MNNSLARNATKAFDLCGSSPQTCVVVSIISVIFVCAVVGNILVIVAVWQNRSLRTNTNILLINLSLADLLFATVVMPCTIVSYLRSSFIFGAAFCVVYNYAQGVSVGLSAFTLTVLSLERCYAVCKPLSSRYWQTTNHCYKMIAFTWVLALIVMIPIAVTSILVEHPNGQWKKCREDWQIRGMQRFELPYTIALDVILFGIPLVIMIVAYMKIGFAICKSIEVSESDAMLLQNLTVTRSSPISCIKGVVHKGPRRMRKVRHEMDVGMDEVEQAKANSVSLCDMEPKCVTYRRTITRLHNKKKVIRMVVVIILQFFICWAPVYALQTWMSIDPKSANKYISSTMNITLRLLAYASTIAHPLTYCFMNSNFRRGFMQIFKCNTQVAKATPL